MAKPNDEIEIGVRIVTLLGEAENLEARAERASEDTDAGCAARTRYFTEANNKRLQVIGITQAVHNL